MKLMDVYQRIKDGPASVSWAERQRQATEGLDAAALADLHTVAEHFTFGLKSELMDRIGFRGWLGRTVEAHLGMPWCIGGVPEGMHYCICDPPTEDLRDWYGDDTDPSVAAAARVVACADDVTVVLTEDGGLALLTTSKRCAPPAALTKDGEP